MIWFTSDSHLGHNNIRKHCNRPFDTIEDMDETIIKNWNEVVKPTDSVWHLGDYSWKSAGYYKRRLNGDINLILGNHDYKRLSISDYKLFQSINSLFEFKQGKDLSITLCHFAMRVWNKSHFGSFHIFGHSHGKLQPFGKSVDVGIDSPWITGHIEYRPFHIDEVVSFLNLQEKGQIHVNPKT